MTGIKPQDQMQFQENFSLMVHGGAGTLAAFGGKDKIKQCQNSIRKVLVAGRQQLAAGNCAVDVVEYCAAMLEDDPLFNAGIGSVLNEYGQVEMDAAIMDGNGLHAGAVAGISRIRNPVKLARQVMQKSDHVMLIGEGAQQFARQQGFELVENTFVITAERRLHWEQYRQGKDHKSKYGTIGAVARDVSGNLAAATSTGGITNKQSGRVGDSPIIGAGVYADNSTCAISCTGVGEDFIRTALAKTVSDLIEFRGLAAHEAQAQGIAYLQHKLEGCGGFILIDHQGRCASGYTTENMVHGWIEHGSDVICCA